ncbi:ATP-binding domain-containing protein [Mesoaciditoga lauensis]|uniref:ATP-binding domain-containing protein n=1 Tax=Mesoaciditoga lauensis TaxID=1495039 RepID=UPI001FE222B0|nr:ATP-binding domain-containing protein [Mesoaciditoga lauensis]
MKYEDLRLKDELHQELHEDQKRALKEIESFLDSPDENVFILSGPTLTGKSFLINSINISATKKGFNSKLFTISHHVIETLINSNFRDKKSVFKSIYSTIYYGHREKEEEKQKKSEKPIKMKVTEIKSERKTLLIVENSELVLDNFFAFPFAIFGSGRVLKDFIKYSGIKKENLKKLRKIIFIGDNYEIGVSKNSKCALNSTYIEKNYDLKVREYHLFKPKVSTPIVKELMKCVNQIESGIYNDLCLNFSQELINISQDEAVEKIREQIINGDHVHILTYSHAKAKKINSWIKREILHNGRNISPGDLVIFNNNMLNFATVKKVCNETWKEEVEILKKKITLRFRKLIVDLDGEEKEVTNLENYMESDKEDEFSSLKIKVLRDLAINDKRYEKVVLSKNNKTITRGDLVVIFNTVGSNFKFLNGDFATVKKFDGKTWKEVVEISKTKIALRFRNLIVKLNGEEKRITSLENYMESDKGELSSLEIKALRKLAAKNEEYRKVALLKFGWALTVHKAKSFKWNEIFFDMEREHRTNEDYFRWIYTGMSRAVSKLYLINYKPINALMKSTLQISNSGRKSHIFLTFSQNENDRQDLSELAECDSNSFDFPSRRLQMLFLFVRKNVDSSIKISDVKHLDYSEIYEIERGENEKATLKFFYDKNWNLKLPQIVKTNSQSLVETFIKSLNTPIVDFSFVRDSWRRKIYEKLQEELKKHDSFIANILQESYKDTLRIANYENQELEVDMNYDGKGFFSTLNVYHYSNETILSSFKDALSYFVNDFKRG